MLTRGEYFRAASFRRRMLICHTMLYRAPRRADERHFHGLVKWAISCLDYASPTETFRRPSPFRHLLSRRFIGHFCRSFTHFLR